MLKTLYNVWVKPIKGNTHKERLEDFYQCQAKEYDSFREKLLWGRETMLQACAARIPADKSDLVWVDIGGGTGYNVEQMEKYIDLRRFSAIYIVDLCDALCKEAELRVKTNKWTNVHVINQDACEFTLSNIKADLVTFSYSLSMIPSFNKVIDQTREYLNPDTGIIGVCDFYVSNKHEPFNTMSWLKRFFWRAIFDLDNIDLGPERRNYLHYRYSTQWERYEYGSIPLVPLLKAPYYVWIGNLTDNTPKEIKECDIKIPHSSFVYNISWEDPKADAKHLDWNRYDVVLSLCGGGCNLFELLLKNVHSVVGVDLNPAQTALVELKKVAFQRLTYADVWKLFGEGIYEDIDILYKVQLAPFLSRQTDLFWRDRLWYFKKGLYNQGGVGKLCWVIRGVLGRLYSKLNGCQSLTEQYKIWTSATNTNLFHYFMKTITSCEWILWYAGGVPKAQQSLIEKSIFEYCYDVINELFKYTDINKENYFYYNILFGKFTPDNCPDYLKEENFEAIKSRVKRLTIYNDTFLHQLSNQMYTKVIMMDHIDWMDEKYAIQVVETLKNKLTKNGLVAFRSAANEPFYASILEKAGFTLKHKETRKDRVDDKPLDLVNMYSSFYVFEN